jgi:hypothetical protein
MSALIIRVCKFSLKKTHTHCIYDIYEQSLCIVIRIFEQIRLYLIVLFDSPSTARCIFDDAWTGVLRLLVLCVYGFITDIEVPNILAHLFEMRYQWSDDQQ